MKESFLIDVLKKGVSPFHCVEAAMQTLEKSGFEELEYARPWNLKKGKAYMMNHHPDSFRSHAAWYRRISGQSRDPYEI